jgi:hypothetical protein
MSVYLKHYIIWGWKLDKSKYESSVSTLHNWDEVNPMSPCEVIIDQMGGNYILFGQVVERSQNDYEPIFEYTPIYQSYLITQDELTSEFKFAFGSLPEKEPKLFIITHVW